jgi:hypothetical protein
MFLSHETRPVGSHEQKSRGHRQGCEAKVFMEAEPKKPATTQQQSDHTFADFNNLLGYLPSI